MKIRSATEAEAPQLQALTFRSKAYWGYSAAVQEMWEAGYTGPSPEAFANDLVRVLESDMFSGQNRTRLLGYYALSLPGEGDERSLTHLFVDYDYIRQGCGGRLLRAAMEQAEELGVTELKVVADRNAAPFYGRYGGQPRGIVPPAHPSLPPCIEVSLPVSKYPA